VSEQEHALNALRRVLSGLGAPSIAIAVSGGIDSLTLAATAAPLLGRRLALHHATSPAVPPEATARTRVLAAGWAERCGTSLVVFDAGEFADANYRANPVDRCFFCKTKLYGTIAERLAGSGTLVLSGTNTDDLGDYRPGLRAAEAHGVRHPFVEAGISKAMLRRIAPLVGLEALADLASAPCLSSRIETGLRIEPRSLALVHAVEMLVSERLSPLTVRCRIRHDGLVVELDEPSLARLQPDEAAALRLAIDARAAEGGEPARPARFAAYRTGSAFLRPAAERAAHR
jgi:uncharacterized protein